jgi:hypothetical protein
MRLSTSLVVLHHALLEISVKYFSLSLKFARVKYFSLSLKFARNTSHQRSFLYRILYFFSRLSGVSFHFIRHKLPN